MKIYQVGGSVRDRLLGREAKDMDYVVVGSTPEEMLALGYRSVGEDFPVFLHPKTKDEYALARLERKTGLGYHGFSMDIRNVTLEEDLSRRDLTINAMAVDEAGALVDPYGGAQDLQNKVLRHVAAAFSEDPVRVLRLARFLARFGPEWHVAPETMVLCRQMVSSGELDALTAERVWQEFEKGFGEPTPQLMLSLLTELGVFDLASFAEYRGLATVDESWLTATCASEQATRVARFATALPRSWTTDQVKASRIPSEYREACQAVERVIQANIWHWPQWPVEQRLDLLERLDVLRRPDCFDAMCSVVEARRSAVAADLRDARDRVRAIRQGEVVAGMKDPVAIKAAIRQARLTALS